MPILLILEFLDWKTCNKKKIFFYYSRIEWIKRLFPITSHPVYLQKYDVKIFDDKKESVGKVLYTTVGAIPSNQKEKRVWSLNLTGYLKPNVDTYNIVYDFSKVDYKYKDEITFENIVSGIFTICGRVLDASKIIGFDYKYNDKESTLTIELDTSKWDFRLKKEVLFSYQLNVDDSSCNCNDSSTRCGCYITFNTGPPLEQKAFVGEEYTIEQSATCNCKSGSFTPKLVMTAGDNFPSWLTFTQTESGASGGNAKATISGTPKQSDVPSTGNPPQKTYSVTVIAANTAGTITTSQTFSVTVEE